jgi:hypothetical protein
MKKIIAAVIAMLILAAIPIVCFAQVEGEFYELDGHIFDKWNVCRTTAYGEHGFFQITETAFRPVIAFESLGNYTGVAYELGRELQSEYPDRIQRAEEVFYTVRDRVRYTSDAAQFGYSEFAVNADELADVIETKGIARGDCEDHAILLAVMYKGAGFRSAIVLAPGHAAALVYLPDYNKANVVLSFQGEDGWIWAEATGGSNPLGWMPERYIGAELAAYEVSAEPINLTEPSDGAQPVTVPSQTDVSLVTYMWLPFMVIMLIIVLARLRPLLRRKHRQ